MHSVRPRAVDATGFAIHLETAHASIPGLALRRWGRGCQCFRRQPDAGGGEHFVEDGLGRVVHVEIGDAFFAAPDVHLLALKADHEVGGHAAVRDADAVAWVEAGAYTVIAFARGRLQ